MIYTKTMIYYTKQYFVEHSDTWKCIAPNSTFAYDVTCMIFKLYYLTYTLQNWKLKYVVLEK